MVKSSACTTMPVSVCLFVSTVNTMPHTALVPLRVLLLSPPFPSAGSPWQAETQLNSSTFSAEPQTTTRYYYRRAPFSSASSASPTSRGGARQRHWKRTAQRGLGCPAPARLGAFRILRSFSAPGTNTAQEPAPCRHTRIHAYSRAVSVHILAHLPLLPPPTPSPGSR